MGSRKLNEGLVTLVVLCAVIACLLTQLCSGGEYDLAGSDDFSISSGRDDYSLASETKTKKRERVLMFKADWCGPCNLFVRDEIPKLQKVGWTAGDEYCHIQYVSDAEAGKYGVSGLPGFVYLIDETPVGKISGYMTAKQFTDWTTEVRKPKAAFVDTSTHWTFPGDGRIDLIRHLAGENHGHSIDQLSVMSDEELYNLHDDDHENGRVRRSVVGVSQHRKRVTFLGISF